MELQSPSFNDHLAAVDMEFPTLGALVEVARNRLASGEVMAGFTHRQRQQWTYRCQVGGTPGDFGIQVFKADNRVNLASGSSMSPKRFAATRSPKRNDTDTLINSAAKTHRTPGPTTRRPFLPHGGLVVAAGAGNGDEQDQRNKTATDPLAHIRLRGLANAGGGAGNGA